MALMKRCYVPKEDGQRQKVDDALIEQEVISSHFLSFPVIVREAHKQSLIGQFFRCQKDLHEIV